MEPNIKLLRFSRSAHRSLERIDRVHVDTFCRLAQAKRGRIQARSEWLPESVDVRGGVGWWRLVYPRPYNHAGGAPCDQENPRRKPAESRRPARHRSTWRLLGKRADLRRSRDYDSLRHIYRWLDGDRLRLPEHRYV